MESDAVKMAIERIKARFHPHYGIDGASDSKQLARDCQTLIVALEQAGEPVAYLYHHSDKTIERREDPVGLTALTAADAQAGWTETPLYAHPPQSRVAAEPVGLREDERVAFIRLLDAADRFNGVYSCQDRIAAPLQGQMMLAVQNAYRVLGIGRTKPHTPLATPSQPDPQSRGQAFDGEGEG